MNPDDPALRIRSPRLELRPLRVSDLDVVYPGLTNPEIARYMSWAPHANKEQTVAFLQRVVDDLGTGRSITWAAFHTGAFCGIVSLIAIQRTHRDLVYERGELAYWLEPSWRGKGLMTEACRSVVDFAFGTLGLHRLVVSHVPENAASGALIRRLGFRFVGEEHEAFQKDGIWYNHLLYELLAKDWSNGDRAVPESENRQSQYSR